MTVTRARLTDAHADGIYSVTRCKTGEEKRSQDSQQFGLSNWKQEFPFTEMGKLEDSSSP